MRRLAALLALLVLLGPSVRPAAGRTQAPAFPLAPGTRWTYRATVAWTAGATVRTTTLTWTMTVTAVIRRPDLVVAVIEGHPADLAWYTPGTPPRTRLIVRSGAERYYLLDGERCRAALAALRRGAALPPLEDDELFLDLPLRVGKTFGASAGPRTDAWYRWQVEREERDALRGVRGVPAPGEHPVFVLAFRTHPDQTLVRFAPGVGIVGYDYVHHGTVAAVRARLVALHRGD